MHPIVTVPFLVWDRWDELQDDFFSRVSCSSECFKKPYRDEDAIENGCSADHGDGGDIFELQK